MTRYILISWAMIFLGIILSAVAMTGISPWMVTVFLCTGSALTIAPNILWIHLSETIASETLGRPRSRLISILLFYTLIGITVVFAAISFIPMEPQSVPGSPVVETALLLFAFSAFGTLIACAVLAARRIIDASEAPHVDRGLRIFGYTTGLIYIAIGMFFIGPKLKRIKAQAANTHSGSIP